MNTVADATLDFWAERFVAAGLRAVMTFEKFMELSPPLRERRSQLLLEADVMAQRIERQFPDAALHDGALIEPFHHGVRRQWRRAWFRNDRNHV